MPDSLNGFYYNGNAYINSDRVDSETLIHEVTHPIVDVIDKNNKELFNSLVNEMTALLEWNIIASEVARNYGAEIKDKYSINDFSHIQVKELLTRYIARAANGHISQESWDTTEEAMDKFNGYVAELANGNLKDKINQGEPVNSNDLTGITLSDLSLLLGSLSVEFDTEY